MELEISSHFAKPVSQIRSNPAVVSVERPGFLAGVEESAGFRKERANGGAHAVSTFST